jgi:hypothetical protein
VSKLEGLRRAQLFVLRNPEKLRRRALALRAKGGRDPEPEAAPLPRPGAKSSHVALWAGLVLSGDWR